MVNHAEGKARARGFNGDVNSRIKCLLKKKNRLKICVLLEAASCIFEDREPKASKNIVGDGIQ